MSKNWKGNRKRSIRIWVNRQEQEYPVADSFSSVPVKSAMSDMEVTEENVAKLEDESDELQKKIDKIENIYTILKKKSRMMSTVNKQKLKAIFNNYSDELETCRTRLYNINNFFLEHNVEDKKKIWNIIKHSKSIIEFINRNRIKYSDDPLLFKSIILTMYKKKIHNLLLWKK